MTVRSPLTIAGSDSGGGAGIQADLKTFSALGVYGASRDHRADGAEYARRHRDPRCAAPHFIAAQIDAVFSDLAVGAVKIGMLSQTAAIEAVAAGLDRYGATQRRARSGDGGDFRRPADRRGRRRSLRRRLVPARAGDHAEPAGSGRAAASGDCRAANEQMREQADSLLALGPQAVLIKGGHGSGPESVDLLVDAAQRSALRAPNGSSTRNTHGTGCTLSSAIAAGLAKGRRSSDAVARCQGLHHRRHCGGRHLSIGHGHGPVHHFYARWRTA